MQWLLRFFFSRRHASFAGSSHTLPHPIMLIVINDTTLPLPKSLALRKRTPSRLCHGWSHFHVNQQRLFKENFLFLALRLVTNPFPPSLPPSLVPAPTPAAVADCIIDANTVTCVRSAGSSGLLCHTLAQNIKWRKQPPPPCDSAGKSAGRIYALVGRFHRGARKQQQKKRKLGRWRWRPDIV